MPAYDYRCQNCGRKVRLFFAFSEYGKVSPLCNHCGSQQLRRLIGRVGLAKSEDSRMDSLADDSLLNSLDENDPRSMGRLMRKMSQEMGEDMGDEFNEVVGRLESGESPEAIEQSMPELAAGDPAGPGGSFGDDF